MSMTDQYKRVTPASEKTLRDEFAMTVLPMVYEDGGISDDVRQIAARAYDIADAMMAERGR